MILIRVFTFIGFLIYSVFGGEDYLYWLIIIVFLEGEGIIDEVGKN